jgi:hypothetical protein
MREARKRCIGGKSERHEIQVRGGQNERDGPTGNWWLKIS